MKVRGRSGQPRGIDLVLQPERVEAALWRIHGLEPGPKSRGDLFDHYRPFAAMLARKCFDRRTEGALELQDCTQLAYEGLLRSIERFEPVRGVPFRAYARIRINGHMANGLAQFSEAASQFNHRLRTERDRLRSLRTADEEIPDDPLAALSALSAVIALGLMLEPDDLKSIADIPDPAPSPYESLAWNELMRGIEDQLERLPEREAYVIRQHYQAGVSFQQIAMVLGLSRARISQIHRSGLERLRSRIGKAG